MERVMTVEEKIRRAEEIYERRKQGEVRPVAKVTVNDKKDIKLLKKMVIQILICIAIYFVFYIIQNNQYVFSEDFIHKANEILSYDTNFMELYNKIKDSIFNFMGKEQAIESESNLQEESNEEAIGGAEEIGEEQPIQAEGEKIQNLSQEEIDIQNIKNTTNFMKPVEGVISSKFGQRDTASEGIPKNHTGVDIATNLGTKIRSATDGEVVLSSEEGDYRKTYKDSNRRSKHYLCTL